MNWYRMENTYKFIYEYFWNEAVKLELSTAICAPFIFHGQAA